jgi:hypothetical protein
MLTSVAFLLVATPSLWQRPSQPPLDIGWHDDFDRQGAWQPLDMENRADERLLRPGTLRLSLKHVPDGWPYAYQWSGLKTNILADVARYPVLMAYVTHVHGYAHLDIDVLDADDHPVKTMRSSTINVSTLKDSGEAGEIPEGLVVADLGKELLPANYHLQLRLIVGGANSGCSAEYRWIRFVARKDADRLADHPNIRVPGRLWEGHTEE